MARCGIGHDFANSKAGLGRGGRSSIYAHIVNIAEMA